MLSPLSESCSLPGQTKLASGMKLVTSSQPGIFLKVFGSQRDLEPRFEGVFIK